MMSKKKLLRIIYEYANRCFGGDCIELSEYIDANISGIKQKYNLDADTCKWLENELTNSAGKDYFEKFAPSFAELCKGKGNRLALEFKEGDYLLSLNQYARNIDNDKVTYYESMLQRLCDSDLSDQEKGAKYEIFCQKWFEPLCDYIEKTPASNDKGFDLVGRTSMNAAIAMIDSSIGLNVKVQVKMLSGKADSPVISNFFGAAINLTYENPLEGLLAPTLHIVVSHAGFTQGAQKFAKRHGIFLLTSHEMLLYISEMGDLEKFECIKYLEGLGV